MSECSQCHVPMADAGIFCPVDFPREGFCSYACADAYTTPLRAATVLARVLGRAAGQQWASR